MRFQEARVGQATRTTRFQDWDRFGAISFEMVGVFPRAVPWAGARASLWGWGAWALFELSRLHSVTGDRSGATRF